ncbi:MAG: hypothetical protein ACRC3F_11045 [Billgrantia desiderata]|uniref:hypothetical protein n=1 Tax=Billgrantia desiderata TaxID=52021 RepID=UPI001592C19B|nr:hypothetical protein [Halomonas desiderata]
MEAFSIKMADVYHSAKFSESIRIGLRFKAAIEMEPAGHGGRHWKARSRKKGARGK